MALLGVAVFMRLPRVDRLTLQAIVAQQPVVTLLQRVPVAAGGHRCGQRVGAMHLRHAAQFPQRVLQTGTQTLEALGEADRATLPVRVGQHEVVNQMRERDAADGDAQVGAMGKVGSTESARFVNLGEEHFLGRPLHGSPLLDPPLQGPQLAVGETPWILRLQPGEHRLGQKTRVQRQLLLDAGPDRGERVGARSPGMHHVHLTGQPAEPPILAGRLGVDTSLGRSLSSGPTLMVEAAQALDVQIGDHPKPPCRKGLRIGYRQQGTGKSNCR
jgi:hypothetical protein